MSKKHSKRNIYQDYYQFDFNKIYWSRLVPLFVDKDGLLKCCCCNKYPMKCDNKESATEYAKIQKVFDKSDLLRSDIDSPIYETGWCRADQNADVELVWKIQRKLAELAGFTLRRSSFW